MLSGVSPSTIYFTDRPYKETGTVSTVEFVDSLWSEGPGSFALSPPNADLTCESDGKVVNQAVTLAEPVIDEAADTLTYTAALVPTAGDDDSFAGITCDADAHLFIDDATASAGSCLSTYNCFLGGFCSQTAITLPPSVWEYSNAYQHDTSDKGAALAAGCNGGVGLINWTEGAARLTSRGPLWQDHLPRSIAMCQ